MTVPAQLARVPVRLKGANCCSLDLSGGGFGLIGIKLSFRTKPNDLDGPDRRVFLRIAQGCAEIGHGKQPEGNDLFSVVA